jgi:hypothetical protein
VNPATNERAVAVAQEVLAQLDTYRLGPKTYFRYEGYDPAAPQQTTSSFLNSLTPGDLQDHADTIKQNCQVCLLGACLLAKATLFDRLPTTCLLKDNRGPFREAIVSALEDIFDPETIDLMELAFERTDWIPGMKCIDDDNHQRRVAASQFGRATSDNVARVRAVMENVIAHSGVFRPEVRPDPLSSSAS